MPSSPPPTPQQTTPTTTAVYKRPQSGRWARIFIVCALAAFFYLYEFLVRVMPSALAHDLMHDLNIGAASFGMLSACFFYGYIPLQIPAGMFFDRWGARRILAIMTLLCALATAGFAVSHHLGQTLLLRFIMGASGAFAFTGAAFTAARWISSRYFAMYTGLIQSLGCVGAILGQAPIAHLNHAFGWRHTNLLAAIVGVVFAILIYAFVRDAPPQRRPATQPQPNPGQPANAQPATRHVSLRQHFKAVVHNRQNWWIGAYGGLSWASINLFASLWGIPYLMRYFNTTAVNAGGLVASCWLGVAIGSPVIGWWAEQCRDRLWAMLFCLVSGMISSLLILFDPQLSMTQMGILLFIFGLSAGGQPISFDLIYANNPQQHIGTAIGFNNMCVIAGGLLLQPLAGWILQLHIHQHQHHMLQQYTLIHFQHALSIMPICFGLNLIVILCGIHKSLRLRHAG